MFLFDKLKEIRRNKKIKKKISKFSVIVKNDDAFLFWTVYKCNMIVKLLEEKDYKQSHT